VSARTWGFKSPLAHTEGRTTHLQVGAAADDEYSMSRRVRVLLVSAVGLAVLATGAGTATAGDETPELSGRVTVFAATSLPAAFREIASDFRQQNPDVRVKLVFRASGVLAEQIQEGAAADVFAPADHESMEEVGEQVRGEPVDFARNRLEIAVQEGNPKGIQSLADLSNPDVSVALCSVDTACGQYADQALAMANVELTPTTREPDLPKTLATVQDGEVDAAIVYVTDVVSAQDVTGVKIPDAENVTATYPIAALKQSSNRKAARAFVEYVMSTRGQLTLQEFGFLAP
jgi:molybdate transport system substrate-binding protein